MTEEQIKKLCEIVGRGFLECMRINRLSPNKNYTKDLEPAVEDLKVFIEELLNGR